MNNRYYISSFLGSFILFLVSSISVFLINCRHSKINFEDRLDEISSYLGQLANSKYIYQSLYYNSTGSVQKIIDDYLENVIFPEMQSIIVVDNSDSSLISCSNRSGLSLSQVYSTFQNDILRNKFSVVNSVDLSESEDLLYLRFTINNPHISVVGALKKKTILSEFGMENVSVQSGSNLKYNHDLIESIKNNILVYVTLFIFMCIFWIVIFIQKRLILKGIQLHNQAIRHDLTEAVEISNIAGEMIKKLLLKGKITKEVDKIIHILNYSLAHQDFASSLIKMIGSDRNDEYDTEKIQPVDLDTFMEKFVNQSRTVFNMNKFQFVNEGFSNNVMIKPNSFYGVLINLVKNAVRHGCGQEILINLNSDNSRINLEIKNESEPISKRFLTDIFKPYSKRPGSDGVGLGMYNCRKALMKMGATIKCKYEKKFFSVTVAINTVKARGEYVIEGEPHTYLALDAKSVLADKD